MQHTIIMRVTKVKQPGGQRDKQTEGQNRQRRANK